MGWVSGLSNSKVRSEKLCKQGHQTIYDHIGYKDEAEEKTYGIFHCYRLIRLKIWLLFIIDKILCQKLVYPQEGTTKFYNYRKYGALFVTTLVLIKGLIGGSSLKTHIINR